MNQPDLFAVARTSDPETSHQAAASVKNIRARQAAVLDTLRRYGPLTDYAIAGFYLGPKQSPSGLRTRRHELQELGLVVDTGRREKLPSGRSAIVWGLA